MGRWGDGEGDDGRASDPTVRVPTDRDRYLARLESGWRPESYVVEPRKAGGFVLATLVACPVALAVSGGALIAPDEMGYVDSAVASFAGPILLVAALTALAIWAWWKADLRTPLVAVAPLTFQALGAALIIGFLGLGPSAFLAVLAFPVVMLGTISMLMVALRGLADRPMDGAGALAALVLEFAAFGALTAGSPGTYISGGLGVVVAIAVIGGLVRGREHHQDIATTRTIP